jgi:hypothetical protein
LGWGNDRPTLTFDADVTFVMSATSTRVSNFIFSLAGTGTNITIAITIPLGGDGSIVENCEFKMHATSQFQSFITVTSADDVILRNNRCLGLHTVAGTQGFNITDANQMQIVGNYISGHFGVSALRNSGTAVFRVYIVGNIIENKSSTGGDLAIDMADTGTGVLANNFFGTGLDFEAGFDPGNLSIWENYMWDADDTSGAIIPTALSTS